MYLIVAIILRLQANDGAIGPDSMVWYLRFARRHGLAGHLGGGHPSAVFDVVEAELTERAEPFLARWRHKVVAARVKQLTPMLSAEVRS